MTDTSGQGSQRPHLGLRVAQARTEKRLTQEQLGAKVGCTKGHISRIEAGLTSPSSELLVQLAVALETTTSALTGV